MSEGPVVKLILFGSSRNPVEGVPRKLSPVLVVEAECTPQFYERPEGMRLFSRCGRLLNPGHERPRQGASLGRLPDNSADVPTHLASSRNLRRDGNGADIRVAGDHRPQPEFARFNPLDLEVSLEFVLVVFGRILREPGVEEIEQLLARGQVPSELGNVLSCPFAFFV